MTNTRWRLTKIYVDGHTWTDTANITPDLDDIFTEPGVVGVVLTRTSTNRSGGDESGY